MDRQRLTRVVIVTLSSLCLIGCTTIQDDATRTRVEGALVGCAAGALLAKVLGKDTEEIIAGCALLALIGLAYGSHIADKKEQYANQEDYLNAVLARIDKVTTQSRQYNTALTQDISELRRERSEALLLAEESQARNRALAATAKKQKQLADRASLVLGHMQTEIERHRQIADREQPTAPDYQIQQVNIKISELDSERDQLELAMARLEAIDRRVY